MPGIREVQLEYPKPEMKKYTAVANRMRVRGISVMGGAKILRKPKA
jgi:hypothetical protein